MANKQPAENVEVRNHPVRPQSGNIHTQIYFYGTKWETGDTEHI